MIIDLADILNSNNKDIIRIFTTVNSGKASKPLTAQSIFDSSFDIQEGFYFIHLDNALWEVSKHKKALDTVNIKVDTFVKESMDSFSIEIPTVSIQYSGVIPAIKNEIEKRINKFLETVG